MYVKYSELYKALLGLQGKKFWTLFLYPIFHPSKFYFILITQVIQEIADKRWSQASEVLHQNEADQIPRGESLWLGREARVPSGLEALRLPFQV